MQHFGGKYIHELSFDQKGTRSTSAVENDLSDKTTTDYGTKLKMRTLEWTRQGEGRDEMTKHKRPQGAEVRRL